MIKYYSTRDINKENGVSSAQAIKQGLAADGGLFIPETIPQIDAGFITKLAGLSYTDRAVEVLSLFLEDYTRDELKACCEAAYAEASFPGGAAPLKKVRDGIYSLELWHGPTCAFKDMALQLMPRLLSLALRKTGENRTALILVATSGDTGKAALEGYKDVDGIKIQVYYPAHGVSRVQKLQMITQGGGNVDVCGIEGNFDDAQNGVKAIFADREIAKKLDENGFFLSSANSINWGRLVPQIVYYFSAYCDLILSGDIACGDIIDVCVPTGNFGNIFAGYIAYKMGLPVRRFICASNKNNVLTNFLDTGVYDRNRPFYQTTSPSMDILISSNLERLLYLAAGPEKTAGYMKQQKENGIYSVEPEVFAKITDMFTGLCATDEEAAETIGKYMNEYGYLADTHTAVALACADRFIASSETAVPCVVDSTASPYKFAGSVYEAVTGKAAPEGYEALEALEKVSGTVIPTPLDKLNERTVRFPDVIDPADMPARVLSFAN